MRGIKILDLLKLLGLFQVVPTLCQSPLALLPMHLKISKCTLITITMGYLPQLNWYLKG